jgi:integrase
MARTTDKARRSNGEGSLLKIAGCRFWYAQYYRNGRQIRISTKTEVKQVALKTLRRLLGDCENGAPLLSDMRKIRYADLRQALIDNYIAEGNKSLKEKANGEETIAGLTTLDKFFGYKTAFEDGKIVISDKGVPVTQMTTDAARQFVRERKAEGIGNAAINRSLAGMRRMLNLAKRERKIQDVPYIEFQKEPPARKGFLELDDFEKLIRLLPSHLRPLITLLYFCGARIGEALQIEWSQVDLDSRRIRLEPEQTKTDEARVLPIPPGLVFMLSEMEPKTGRVFDATNLRKEWVNACVAAELGHKIDVPGKPYDPRYEGLTLHDLRRSAVRNLRKVGVPESVAMKISGHKTRSVFERYNIVSDDDVQEAMQKLVTAGLANGKSLRGESRSRSEKMVKKQPGSVRKSLMALSSRG